MLLVRSGHMQSRKLRGANYVKSRHSVVSGFCAQSLLNLLLLANVLFPSLVHAADDGKWWRQVSSNFRSLYGAVYEAERGNRDAMFSAGASFYRGTGSREGPKPDAALQYMEKSANSGHRDAMLFAAVMNSVKEKQLESASVLGWLEKYRKADASIPAPTFKTCGESQSCADYHQLLSGYIQLMLVYPRQARYEGRETVRVAMVDFEKHTVTVEGIPDDFSESVTGAVKGAIDHVPEPKAFNRRGRIGRFPVGFKLTD